MPKPTLPHADVTRFAAALTRLREARGLTVSDLARAAGGMSPIAVDRLAKGVRNPTLTTLVALADALGVSLDVLAGRDGGEG